MPDLFLNLYNELIFQINRYLRLVSSGKKKSNLDEKSIFEKT